MENIEKVSNKDVTTHKFVAVLNKKVDVGKAMNALAHMTISLGAHTGEAERDLMGFVDYMDKDNNHHVLSKNSFVILRADNGNQLRTARRLAIEKGIRVTDFANTMQEGTYIDQLNNTKASTEESLDYFGICMFGEIQTINEITKKFQLYRV